MSKKAATVRSKKEDPNTSAVRLLHDFLEVVRPGDSLSPSPLKRLWHMTFWCGAGFSKAWDPKFPTGAELFDCDMPHLKDERLDALRHALGYGHDDQLSLVRVKDMVYALDMYERYPAIRPRYVDGRWVDECRSALAAWVQERFESLVGLGYLGRGTGKLPPPKRPTLQQREILRFFHRLNNWQDGSRGIAEGGRCHFVTTNYDFVVETILDNILAADDSHSIYTHRGFTPVVLNGHKNFRCIQRHHLAQHLLKLNGGFEILKSQDGFAVDYRRRSAKDRSEQAPVLILPSRAQTYDSPYFQQIFEKSIRLLRESTMILVVGYSLPDEDALLRFILRQFAEEPEDALDRFIVYIDPRKRSESEAAVRQVFAYSGNWKLPTTIVYEGTFNAFVRDFLEHNGRMRVDADN